MFKLNFKITLRNLWKNKAFTLINVGGLAIGLASCMLLLLYVAYEWGYDKQFSNYDKTFVVYLNSKSSTEIKSYPFTPKLMAPEIGKNIPGVAYASHASFPVDELISYKEKNFKKAIVFADPSFLKILDYTFIKGNPNRALQDINTVILTETMAKNLFGDEDPINKVVKFQNREPLIVGAVIADIPKNNTIQFDYLLSWSLNEKLNPWIKTSTWGNNFCFTIVQLKDLKYFDQASRLIKSIYVRNSKDSPNEGLIHPLAKWHLNDQFKNGKSVGGRIDQLRIFIVLAFCILLIACVNFMNLSTARSEKRAREVGVRKAIGSSRNALIWQFMLESMVLSFMGMVIAFTLVELSLPYFNGLLNIKLVLDYGDWRFWTALTGLTLIAGCIAGSYPAFYLSSFEPVKVLKGFSLTGSSSFSIRKILVVFQFVFAACLIVCTGVIYQQLNFIKNKPIGYNRNGLIEIPLQGSLSQKEKMDLVKDQLLKWGAAVSVTYFSQSLKPGANNTHDFSWPGKDPNDLILVNYRGAGDDFTETLGTKLIGGREFSPKFVDTANVMLNEAAVKLMELKKPVGAVIKWDGTPVTVIGVVKDFVMESPYESVNPMVIIYVQINFKYILARLNPDQNMSTSLANVDEVVKKLNPDFPVDRHFINDDFEKKFQNEAIAGYFVQLVWGLCHFYFLFRFTWTGPIYGRTAKKRNQYPQGFRRQYNEYFDIVEQRFY